MRLLSMLIWACVAGLLVGSVHTVATQGVHAASGMGRAGLALTVAGFVVDALRKLVQR